MLSFYYHLFMTHRLKIIRHFSDKSHTCYTEDNNTLLSTNKSPTSQNESEAFIIQYHTLILIYKIKHYQIQLGGLLQSLPNPTQKVFHGQYFCQIRHYQNR